MLLSKSAQKKILAEAKRNGGSISSSKFNELLKDAPLKNNNSKYSFEVKIQKVENQFKVIVLGKHLSTNVHNSISLKERLRYKNSIKRAFNQASLVYKKILPKRPYSAVEIHPTVYLKVSRDDDGTSSSLKIIRDMIVNIGIVEDDKRKNLRQSTPKEEISKEWKIEIMVVPIGEQNNE